MKNPVLVTCDEEENRTVWGVSFDGHNPELKNYVECLSEKDAWKLQNLITKLISKT